jgi:addiction module HigA family antidote
MTSQLTSEYLPELVSVPGETLQEVLDERGISQAELAERTGRPKKTINEIIQGKAAITPETALQLERVLGIPAAFWNNLEGNYRVNQARNLERAELQKYVDWLKKLPVTAMVKHGWINKRGDKVDQLQEVLNFFGLASPLRWDEMVESTAFRKSSAFTVDMGALSAWLRRGEIEGRGMPCRPYNKSGFREVLTQARELTCRPLPEAFKELQRRCSEVGVAVVIISELPKTRVNGATRWLSKDKALIQLSLRYKREDVFWFSFFHEAAHILLHGKRDLFLEGEPGDAEHEREADDFASNVLLPARKYRRFSSRSTFPKGQVIEFAVAMGVHPGIVVGRLQHDKLIDFNYLTDLLRKIDSQSLPTSLAS